MDSLEKLYQTYRDLAEFRIIYIREAHAADSRRPVEYAVEQGITEHKDLSDRCATAEILYKKKSLTIPCLIDSMDDATNSAYQGWPDRIFVVRSDGRIAVSADRGPFGFAPALKKTEAWLEELRNSGSEPPLDDGSPDP